MIAFEVGETVVCYLEIKKGGNYYDPSTALKISIYKPDGTVDVNEADALPGKEAVGKYAYNYDSTNKDKGIYRVRWTAQDGAKITKREANFRLV